MSSILRSFLRTPALWVGVFAFSGLLAQGPAPAPAPAPALAASAAPPATAPAAGSARDLLELAFAAAAAMPTNPHQKNRARVQETVVAACLELGELDLAESFARRIDDWRRGTCLADVAIRRIGGDERGLAELLAEAGRAADAAATDPQAYRRDRIRARLATAQLLLGHDDEARKLAAGIAPADLVGFEAAVSRRAELRDFPAELAKLDAVFAAGQFEAVCNTMVVCVQWYERFFADAERRMALADRVRNASPKLPPPVRAGYLAQLAGIAGKHGDRAGAVALLDQADTLLVPGTTQPEDEVAQRAQWALLRAEVGDVAGARRAAETALALYHGTRERIVDVYRARALRPLAAVHVRLGDLAEASRLYRAAVEEGQQNPNSRPRAEDLAGSCVAMAAVGFHPDEALWQRLQAIAKGLGNPW